jgi:hypothetical protein
MYPGVKSVVWLSNAYPKVAAKRIWYVRVLTWCFVQRGCFLFVQYGLYSRPVLSRSLKRLPLFESDYYAYYCYTFDFCPFRDGCILLSKMRCDNCVLMIEKQRNIVHFTGSRLQSVSRNSITGDFNHKSLVLMRALWSYLLLSPAIHLFLEALVVWVSEIFLQIYFYVFKKSNLGPTRCKADQMHLLITLSSRPCWKAKETLAPWSDPRVLAMGISQRTEKDRGDSLRIPA